MIFTNVTSKSKMSMSNFDLERLYICVYVSVYICRIINCFRKHWGWGVYKCSCSTEIHQPTLFEHILRDCMYINYLVSDFIQLIKNMYKKLCLFLFFNAENFMKIE